MLWIEIKKNTVSIVFVIAMLLVMGFTFLSIVPEVDYYYSKPLSFGEYSYFKLKEDVKQGSLVVYGGEEGNGIPVDLEINEEIRARLEEIITRINPSFNADEKMSEVEISLTDKEILELINGFEKTIGYRTNYHYGEKSGLYAVYKYKRFGINRLHDDNRNTVKEEREIFNYSLKSGLAEGYARYFMNYMGILTSLVSAVISATVFIKDRQNYVREFIYASNSKSSKIILIRIASVVIPICLMTLIMTIIGAVYFYSESITYGYIISCIPFIKYWAVWIVPTILVTVSLSVFLDILSNNLILVFGVQFIVWLLSIATFMGNYEIWRVVIRFSSFGMDKYYDGIKNDIYINRIFMVFLSIIITAISVTIFDKARNGRRLKYRWNYINDIFFDRLSKKKHEQLCCKGKSFLVYQLKLACNSNVIISILFLLVLLIRFANRNMNEYDIKTTGENIVIFFSMFMLLPLCNIEKRNGVTEFTYTVRTSYTKIYFARFIMGVMLTVGLITFSLYLISYMNDVGIGLWAISICISSLYLGLFGVIFSEATGKEIAGYVAYLGYYLFCAVGKENVIFLNVCCYTNHLKYSVISLIAGVYIMAVILFFIVKGKGLGRN